MNPVFLLLRWIATPATLLATGLICTLVISAIGVTYSAHVTRNMYRDLQQLEKDDDDLDHEYEKLLLERSAWADYTRLNEIASTELAMSAPKPNDTVVIQ